MSVLRPASLHFPLFSFLSLAARGFTLLDTYRESVCEGVQQTILITSTTRVRPDAAILLRTLDNDEEDTASLRETLRSEIASERCSRAIFSKLLEAVRKAQFVTELPSSQWPVGTAFDYSAY